MAIGTTQVAAPLYDPNVGCPGSYGTTWKGRLPVLADYDIPAGVPHLVFLGDTVRDWSQW
jgi:hypothetical protein